MPIVIYTGNVIDEVTLNRGRTTPNPSIIPVNRTGNNYIFNTGLGGKIPTWEPPGPPSNISNIPLSQLIKNSDIYGTKLQFQVLLKGSISEDESFDGGGALFTFTLYATLAKNNNKNKSKLLPFNNAGEIMVDTSGSCMGNQFCFNQNEFLYIDPGIVMNYFNIDISNQNSRFDLMNVSSFALNIIITLELDCKGPTLERQICISYCSESPSKQEKCRDDYVTYCKGIIGTNKNCQNFIENYIQGVTPTTGIDDLLYNYCSKYNTFNDFLERTKNDETEKKLCACHLPTELYENLKNSVFQRFPALQNVSGINPFCLFPPCVISPFKNLSTTKQCAVPNCLNIAAFNNNGTVKGGVKINQNSKCASVKRNTTTTTNKITIILVAGAVAIFLIILVILAF